jgi:hypothetical protein
MNEDFYEPSLVGQLAESFSEGGWPMYPLTFLLCALPVVALVLLAVGIFSKKNLALPLGVGLLVAAFLPPALSLVTSALGRAEAEKAIAMAAPEDQEMIRRASESELLVQSTTGTSGALCPGFFGCVLIGVGLARRSRFG